MTVNDALPTHEDQFERERFGPGSDIYKSHPDQVIGTINNTHVLALNIYPVFRPQYLLLNLDSYRSQNDPLDLEDIEASWSVLHSVQSPHYVMYNCTKEAGCSRNHKHLQIVKKPEVAVSDPTGFLFFPDVTDQEIRVPYVYFLHRFDDIGQERPTESDFVFQVYSELLGKCRKALHIAETDTTSLCAHNMLLVKEWMIVLPRRSGNFKGASANAAGMMGMPTISNDELLRIWTDVGPTRVLKELGVAADIA